jgi:hypothetical protein
VGTQLPRSDVYRVSQVQLMAENVPANTAANHDAQPIGADFHWVLSDPQRGSRGGRPQYSGLAEAVTR